MAARSGSLPRTWPYWLGFAAVVGAALRLTYLAYQELLPPPLQPYDKIVHFTIAGLLAFFLDGAIRRRTFALFGVSLPVAAVGLLTLIGAEEFAQRYSVHRTASFSDFAADVAGVTLLTWLSRRVGPSSSEPGLADPGDDRAE